MSKYIRTENGRIIDTTKVATGKKYMDFATNDESFRAIFEIEPLSKADTIEELCDEFVIVDKKTNHHRIWLYSNDDLRSHYLYNKSTKEVYGAIWTDKGLIYVAKMNEKGELELL